MELKRAVASLVCTHFSRVSSNQSADFSITWSGPFLDNLCTAVQGNTSVY